MFMFRTFDTYVVKVVRRHPKEKRRWLKHHTTFSVSQQAPDNTYDFYVCLSRVVFGAHMNCDVCVSAFNLLYYRCLWLNMHINLLLIHTSHFIMWQDYETTLSGTQQVLASSTLERGYACSLYLKSLIKREIFITIQRIRWQLCFV
jgi:hypothetical protein